MSALKCPNPSCSFLFDPTRVPAGAVLTCPRCAMRFTLAAPPPVLAATVPVPVRPVVNPPVTPTRSRGGSPLSALAAVGGVVLGLAVLAGAIVLVARDRHPAAPAGPAEAEVTDKNFAYRVPAGWDKDLTAQNDLGVNVVAVRRAADPKAFAALHVADFDTRAPLASELRATAGQKLGRLAAGIPADVPLEPATWAGKPAFRYVFRGQLRSTGVAVVGEVTALSYGGVAYWFFGWAAEADAAAVAADLDAVRGQFRLLDRRDRWTPKATTEVVFRSVNNNSKFRLTTADPFWSPPPGRTPADEHPAAELLLRGVFPGTGRDTPPEAEVVVFVLPAGPDAAAQAEAFVRARYTRDEAVFGKWELNPATGDVQGEAAGAEASTGRPVTRLTYQAAGPDVSKSGNKLIVYAFDTPAGNTVVAEASCPLRERPVWERRLVQFVGSLRGN